AGPDLRGGGRARRGRGALRVRGGRGADRGIPGVPRSGPPRGLRPVVRRGIRPGGDRGASHVSAAPPRSVRGRDARLAVRSRCTLTSRAGPCTVDILVTTGVQLRAHREGKAPAAAREGEGGDD